MVDLATRAMLGEKLKDMGYGTGLYPTSPYVAVKVPIFSFEKLADVDNHLGPEMKSTGEVLGIASALEADGNTIPFDERFSVNGHEGGLWLLTLPLTAEGGDLAEELSFSVTADAADASAALPVSIHITR